MNLRQTTFPRSTLGTLILTGIVIIVGLTMIVTGVAKNRFSSQPGASSSPAGNQEVILPNSGGNPSPTATFASPSTALSGNVLIKNCTYTSDYWQAHPDIWLAENMIIGKLSYSKPDALAILRNASPDLSTSILKQFITAVLNTLNGADAAPVQPFLNDASGWLTANLSEPVISDADQNRGVSLAQSLEEYNQGILGPGLCPDQPFTATPTPSLTPTITPTPTPPYIPLSVPETPLSPTPDRSGGSSGGRPPAPTATSVNPTAFPQPTLAPTSTPAPPPTQPPPPTAPPAPTQPLPTPTNPPEPTKEHKPTHTPKPTPTSPDQLPPTNTLQLLPTNTPEPTKEHKPTHTPKAITSFEYLGIPFDLFGAL